MKCLRILPEMCASTWCRFSSSSTRNIAFGSVSRTFAMTSIASSFAILSVRRKSAFAGKLRILTCAFSNAKRWYNQRFWNAKSSRNVHDLLLRCSGRTHKTLKRSNVASTTVGFPPASVRGGPRNRSGRNGLPG